MKISENNLYVQYAEWIQNKNLRIKKYILPRIYTMGHWDLGCPLRVKSISAKRCFCSIAVTLVEFVKKRTLHFFAIFNKIKN